MPSGGPRQLPEGPPLDAASAALHESVKKENPGGITRAIKKGADVESLHPKLRETVLMLAGRFCNFKIVDILLKAGASVSTLSVENYTALHTACLGGSPSIVRRLLKEGASVSSRTKFGDTPFISAALKGHKEVVELLLDAGADIDACDQNGRTGLMWASTHGRGDMVARLLAAGAKHDLHDDKGAQALHNATEHEQLGAMAALIRAGASPSCGRSDDRETPLHMAVRRKLFKSARLLLRAGARADVKDHTCMTPLHCAVSDGYTQMVHEILSYVRRQDIALVSSEDIGLGMENVASAAMQRSRQQQQRCGDVSIAGPRMRRVLTARNDQGWTALHIAAMVYSVDIVDLLLRFGALETEIDRIGETAFLYPVKCVKNDPIPVILNRKEIVPDIARAYRIIQSLSRARAARARSWLFPALESTSVTSERTVATARPAAKRNRAVAVRVLQVTNTRGNSVFLRAVSRYVQAKGHVVLEDGQILAPPRTPSNKQVATDRRGGVYCVFVGRAEYFTGKGCSISLPFSREHMRREVFAREMLPGVLGRRQNPQGVPQLDKATFQRVRHSCWQTGARLCGRDNSDTPGCACCCRRPDLNGSGGGGGSTNVNSCGRRRAGLCCSWLSSLLFGWDWVPLPTSGGPAAAGGNGGPASESLRHGSGHLGVSSRSSGVVGVGDAGGAGMRRLASSSSSGSGGGGGGGGGSDDVKPLLARTISAEFRDKEKRFIKGRFVMPGSDVQRRIADAMAGMLKAGGRAMTGTESASSGGAIGGAADHPHRHSASNEGYRGVDGQDSPTRRREEEDGRFRPLSPSTSLSSPPPSSSFRDFADGSGGGSSPSRQAFSGRRGAPGERDGFGGGLGGQQDERECVICMEEFSKEDPEMLTLCSCGVNKTFFHYSCLLQWLSKHSYCPACRGYLFFEERRTGGGDRSQNRSGNSTRHTGRAGHGGEGTSGNSSGSGRVGASSVTATTAALRAGLGSCSSPRGARTSDPP
eukprot:g19520.t2